MTKVWNLVLVLFKLLKKINICVYRHKLLSNNSYYFLTM